MKQSYDDIMEATGGKQPTWWDELGVPRFCEPHPSQVNNIYATEVCFFYIRCQACHKEFLVGIDGGFFGVDSLYRCLMDHGMAYGDPPSTGCCMAGPTMSSEELKVHSFWFKQREKGDDWMKWKEITELRGKDIRDNETKETTDVDTVRGQQGSSQVEASS